MQTKHYSNSQFKRKEDKWLITELKQEKDRLLDLQPCTHLSLKVSTQL